MEATDVLLPAEADEMEAAQKRLARKKAGPTISGGDERRATAESMASKQRDISVSEFFAKNRHLLGFDNPRKALLTTVKEAVDNSLDACEEAGILPDITVVIEDLAPAAAESPGGKSSSEAGGKKGKAALSSRYRVTVVDNGPGIVRKQVENVFGRLLFGSKFHRLKMSRGQQGIGISAAGMYGLITTGRPMVIHTRPNANKPAHHIELAMNTKTNRAEVTVDDETEEFPPTRLRTLTSGTRELNDSGQFLGADDYPTGTSVSIELEGKYQKGRGSVDEFLELTAIANPHARITFVSPGRVSVDEVDETDEKQGGKLRFVKPIPTLGDDEGARPPEQAGTQAASAGVPSDVKTLELGGTTVFPRAVAELPPETREIQPHPRGIELGILLQMFKEHPEGTLYNFLQERFCRVSPAAARKICDAVDLTSRTKVADVDHDLAEKLFRELQDSQLPPPPTDCLAPIGVRQLLAGLLKGVRAEFYAASSREAAVYRGRPFQIEAAIAFGGELPGDDSARVIRFANRVPLLYQQSACSSFKSVVETNWRNYDLQHPRGSLPIGPLVIMIHMASVWVPFTSESKEAIADYDEIRKEMKLALMECGRKLGAYMRKRQRMKRESERRDVFQKYIGEITKAVSAINGTDAAKLYESLLSQAKKRTAIADLQLDEDGKRIKEEDPADQDGVIIVEKAIATPAQDEPPSAAPAAPKQNNPVTRQSRKHSRGDEDDGQTAPLLPDAISPKGGKKPASESKGKARPGERSEGKGSTKPAAVAPPPPTPNAAPPAKTPKPKMRLDPKTGKLSRIDEGPGLF